MLFAATVARAEAAEFAAFVARARAAPPPAVPVRAATCHDKERREDHTDPMTDTPNAKRRFLERLNLVYPQRPAPNARSPLGRIVLLEERVSALEARLRRVEGKGGEG